MTERNGVRIGQRVRDLDGNRLGRVREIYDAGFSVVKGLPLLFRTDFVARWDEIREVRDGAVVLARSKSDLLALARGEIPPSWRIPALDGRPQAATPSEARLELAEDRAAPPEPRTSHRGNRSP